MLYFDIFVRTRITINTDPLRRCYDGCHFSTKVVWSPWTILEYKIPEDGLEDRLTFWKSLNDYAVSARGEGARRQFMGCLNIL
jgi:hypothetical protein